MLTGQWLNHAGHTARIAYINNTLAEKRLGACSSVDTYLAVPVEVEDLAHLVQDVRVLMETRELDDMILILQHDRVIG